MATVTIEPRSYGRGDDSVDPFQSPVFVGLDDASLAPDWLIVGAYAVLPAAVDAGSGSDTLAASVRHGVTIADEAAGSDALVLTAAVVVVVDLAMSDAGDGTEALALAGTFTLTASDAGAGTETVSVGPPPLPVPSAALPGEIAGTVNLVRNPSLEYSDIGLRDWSSEAGITLTRDNATAWDRSWSALATVAAGAGSPGVMVLSLGGIGFTGQRSYVGSIALLGTALLARIWLTLIYQDATSTIGELTDVVPTADWVRVETVPVAQNPAKMLDRIEFWTAVVQEAGVVTLRLDGAQIEEALSGGATPYVDGDQGEGHHWWGAEGWSVSYREAA